ncbi:MAG: response regulator [Candidatus Zhuqueibacterota bacterium]
MSNPLVLVADGDPKNLQILKENLEASGFIVITVSTGNRAWEEIQRTPPKLILSELNLPGMTGYQLLERLQADPNTASIPLIFLTNQREIQQRVRSFELGAKDYLVKPLHVKEVIAHIRMVLRRLERRKVEQLETYMKFSGRLDQLNLADLIESFGVERKTGVLTLSNGRRTGQVYFREGTVVNASLGDVKLEQAVYQMFSWKHGFFNMVFRDVDVPDGISISNLGLLLQGMKRMETRENLIAQLSSPKTAFIITPTFKNIVERKKVGDAVSSFIQLLDGKRDVEQIIDDSGADDLVTLKRIIRLYQQGFIKATIPPAKKEVTQQQPVIEPKKIEPRKPVETAEEILRRMEKPVAPDEATPAIPDDNVFEVAPRKERKNLEDEIKPIVERIQAERREVYIPETEEESEEQLIQQDEPPTTGYARFAEEDVQDSFPVSHTEDVHAPVAEVEEEILAKAEKQETFVDEELLQQPIEENIEAEPVVNLPKKEKIPVAMSDTSRTVASRAPTDRNNIMLISVDEDCKDELMDVLTGNKFQSKSIKELEDLRLEIGKINFEKFPAYNLIAISLDKQFNIFLESVKNSIIGNVFTFDCSRQETWEYTNYLIHSIWHKFKIPYVIAVINLHEHNSISMDVIRYQLNLDMDVALIAWDPVDKSSIRKVMSTVIKGDLRKEQNKTAVMLDSLVEKMMM